MKDYIRKELLDITKEIATGEHIAGLNDKGEAERIISILEKHFKGSLNIKKIDFPLISWRSKEVEVEPKGSFSIAPYVESFDVEGKVFFMEKDPSEPQSWRNFPEEHIAVSPEPENPDELKAAALLAYESGAKALLVYTKNFVLRKIVTTGSWGYSFSLGAPSPLPVLYIDKGLLSNIKRHMKVRILIKAETVRTSGIILEAESGWDRGRPIFGAHYDRWFRGFQDNSLGIAQAFLAWRESLKEIGGAKLLIFSAEEHGSPGYAGWYWAWGSRWYSRQLEKLDLVESLGPYVNFDASGTEPLKISGSPQLLCNIPKNGWMERCCECPECDSFSFASVGLETLSFHSLWSERLREIYHTPLDNEDNINLDVAQMSVILALKAIKEGSRWNCFSERLREWLGSSGLLARRALYLIESLASRIGWKTLYPYLSKRFLKAVNYGDYRWSSGDLEALWFPEVLTYGRILDDLDKGRKVPLEVWISGEERLLYVIGWHQGSSTRASLSEQNHENMKRLNEILEEIKREVLA